MLSFMVLMAQSLLGDIGATFGGKLKGNLFLWSQQVK